MKFQVYPSCVGKSEFAQQAQAQDGGGSATHERLRRAETDLVAEVRDEGEGNIWQVMGEGLREALHRGKRVSQTAEAMGGHHSPLLGADPAGRMCPGSIEERRRDLYAPATPCPAMSA